MRTRFRQFAGLMAIIAIALHTALWGVAVAHPVAPGADPFSVICHSDAGATLVADQLPANPVSAPTHACDHCNLCATAPPSNLPDTVVIFKLDPARLLHRLTEANVLPRAGITKRSNPARAPPVFA